jgi:hypothetical protein
VCVVGRGEGCVWEGLDGRKRAGFMFWLSPLLAD